MELAGADVTLEARGWHDARNVTSEKMWVASGSWVTQGNGISPEVPRKNAASTNTLIIDFWPLQLQENKFAPFQATKLVVLVTAAVGNGYMRS